MAELRKKKDGEHAGTRRWVDDFVLEGPWTEADEIWLECMTGEYDRRWWREFYAREAAEADL